MINKFVKLALAGSALLCVLGTTKAAVQVVNAASGGYGIDLDSSLQVTALGETLTLSVGTDGPLGEFKGSGNSPYSGFAAQNAVTLTGSATGSGVISPLIAATVSSLFPLNVPLGVPGLTTFAGGGNFLSPSPFAGFQTVSGYGAVEQLSVDVFGLLSLKLGVLESEATVAVNTTSTSTIGSLTGLADANIADLSLSILGFKLPIDLSLTPNTTVKLGPVDLALNARLATVDLDSYIELTFNEQSFFIDDNPGILTKDCAAATFSCGVSTNALRLSVDVDGLVTALGLTGLGVSGDIDLIMGSSFAYASAVAVAAPVPEPTTYLLMLGGVAALAAVSRKRKIAMSK